MIKERHKGRQNNDVRSWVRFKSSEEFMAGGIDETDTEDVATEVQTVYDASKQVLRLLLCDSLGLRKYDARKTSRIFKQ